MASEPPALECRGTLASSAVAGGLCFAGIAVLRADAHRLFTHLLGPALPLVVLSGMSGLAAVVLLSRQAVPLARVLATVAVGAVVLGWGAAQYPFLLRVNLRITDAAAPNNALWAVLVIFVGAALLCGPSLAYLYILQQRGTLETG
jgi:cytochrome d ubiquinol oxidase subunit II